jgi:hypothetical protein
VFNTRLLLRALAFVVTANAPLSADDAAAHVAVPHIRFDDPLISAAMARGESRSPTFRRLVERLTASDVIAYVERRPPTGSAGGFTQFVSSTPYARYVRIVLDVDKVNDGMVGLLGHELRHALEVADAPSVVDQDTYAALYRAIGKASCDAPRWCFDTTAAVSAGRRVFKEVRAAGRSLRDLAAGEE